MCIRDRSDILMSVLAMFSLKYESLLEFDQQSESSLSNLQNLFGIKQIGSDSCIRKAVSYTHLDVYKRQVLKFVMIEPHIVARSGHFVLAFLGIVAG